MCDLHLAVHAPRHPCASPTEACCSQQKFMRATVATSTRQPGARPRKTPAARPLAWAEACRVRGDGDDESREQDTEETRPAGRAAPRPTTQAPS